MWLCYGRMIASPVLELGSGQLLVQLRRAPASSWSAPEELLVQLRRSSRRAGSMTRLGQDWDGAVTLARPLGIRLARESWRLETEGVAQVTTMAQRPGDELQRSSEPLLVGI